VHSVAAAIFTAGYVEAARTGSREVGGVGCVTTATVRFDICMQRALQAAAGRAEELAHVVDAAVRTRTGQRARADVATDGRLVKRTIVRLSH